MTLDIEIPTTKDIDSIHELLNYYSKKEVILERTKEDIEDSINNFLIARYDNKIIGAISYYEYDNNLKEIRSLAVLNKFKKLGVGTKLIKALIDKIQVKEQLRIFALTYSPDFFITNGFTEIDKNLLPEKIWKDCDKCKNKKNCGEIALLYNN
ncbi:GNAT family N-acetyltransferase [Spirochaetota bacterium]